MKSFKGSKWQRHRGYSNFVALCLCGCVTDL
jgi:hypothetical protein